MRTLTKFKKHIVLRDLRVNFISSINKNVFAELCRGTKSALFLFFCVMLFPSFSSLALAEDNEGISPLLNNETPSDPAFIFLEKGKTCCLCIQGDNAGHLCSDAEDSRFSSYLSQDGRKCDVRKNILINYFRLNPTVGLDFFTMNGCTNAHTYYAGHSGSGPHRPYSLEVIAALFQSCPGGECSFRDLGCNGGAVFGNNNPMQCKETQAFISVMCERLKKGGVEQVVTFTANQTQVMDGHPDKNTTVTLEVSYSPDDPNCSSKVIFPSCSSMAKECNYKSRGESYFCMEDNKMQVWKCVNNGLPDVAYGENQSSPWANWVFKLQ